MGEEVPKIIISTVERQMICLVEWFKHYSVSAKNFDPHVASQLVYQSDKLITRDSQDREILISFDNLMERSITFYRHPEQISFVYTRLGRNSSDRQLFQHLKSIAAVKLPTSGPEAIPAIHLLTKSGSSLSVFTDHTETVIK